MQDRTLTRPLTLTLTGKIFVTQLESLTRTLALTLKDKASLTLTLTLTVAITLALEGKIFITRQEFLAGEKIVVKISEIEKPELEDFDEAIRFRIKVEDFDEAMGL